VAALVDANSTI